MVCGAAMAAEPEPFCRHSILGHRFPFSGGGTLLDRHARRHSGLDLDASFQHLGHFGGNPGLRGAGALSGENRAADSELPVGDPLHKRSQLFCPYPTEPGSEKSQYSRGFAACLFSIRLAYVAPRRTRQAFPDLWGWYGEPSLLSSQFSPNSRLLRCIACRQQLLSSSPFPGTGNSLLSGALHTANLQFCLDGEQAADYGRWNPGRKVLQGF